MSEKKIRVFNTITAQDLQGKGAKTLAIRPNEPANYGQGSLSGRQLQLRFDSLADLVINRYNEMANGISSSDALEYFYLPKIDGDQITLGTGADEKVDLSSFIKKISDKAGDLVVETPYENSTVTTIKSILAQIYTDLQEIYDDYATKAALQQHSSDKDADGKDVTDTHPSIRGLIPAKIDEHNISTVAHSDIRNKIGTDIALHNSDKDADGNVVTTTHPEIRKEIDSDISVHNISTVAHSDIRALIDGIIGTNGTLTQLEKVVNGFLAGAADNTTLDTLKEIVAYIELNRETIDRIIGVNGAEGLLDGKIDKTSIAKDLTTEDDTKVLAASVGKTITEELNKRVLIDAEDPVVRESDLGGYAVESDENPIVRANTLQNYAQTTTADGSVVREKTNNPVIKQDALDRALAGFTGGSSQFSDAFAAELLRLFGTNGTKGLAYYINGLAGMGRAWCCGKGKSTETDITIGYLAEGCSVYAVRDFEETDITSVVIPEGITIIESKAFYKCSSLTQATLPDSLKTIGIRAFEGCDNLEYIHISDIAKWCRIIFDDGVSQPLNNKKCKLCINGIILEDLVIPDNVKEISQLAFYGYQFLKSVVINDVVTELYANTFYNCSNLKSITLGKGINNIVRSPVMPIFDGCSSLENIMVNEENTYYKSIDGNLYERENSAIMQYAVGKKDASFLLPYNVEHIGHDAFHSAKKLMSVRFRGNLHEIGDRAFEGCSNLTTAKIDYGCDITEIPYACFRYSNLKYINIPRSVTRIYGYAFHSCPLTEVYYDGSEDEWNAITINSNNEELNNANIYFASQGLEYVYDDYGICSVVGVGECTNTEIMIPSRDENSDTAVAFLGNITGEDNPDHNATFNYGNNITYLRIPETILGIAKNAFANCETIEKVRIATGISRYAFYNCANLTEVIIEPGVDFISGYAFYGCTALNSIYIPISVTEIGDFAFAHVSNLNIYYEGTQEQWNQIDKAVQWGGYMSGKINYNQRG